MSVWALATADVLVSLGSSTTGLSTAEAAMHLQTYGANRLKADERSETLEALLRQLRNPLAWLLMFAATVSGIAGEWTDAGVVIGILVLSGLLGFLQERRAGQAIRALRERIEHRASVLRDGREVTLPVDEIVPGDVVTLSAGTLIPADAVVLRGKDLFVNEAVLTGETYPVEKSPGVSNADATLAERRNMVFQGTSVRSGTGHAVVVQTGARTEFGRIAGRLQLRAPETDFERGIRRFGMLLTRVMVVLVFVVFAASVLRHKPAVESLLFAIALAVGLAPEMLPAILSITLAHGARAMAKRGVVVRHLNAIENFGGMDVLCTDKTGTLTAGVMCLERGVDCLGAPSATVLEYALWNAKLQTGLSNPLDDAIVAAAGESTAALPEKLDEVPYDFHRKRLSVAVRRADQPYLLVTKGAVEPLVDVCTRVRESSAIVALDEARRAALLARFHAWSAEGLRAIGVATRPGTAQQQLHAEDEREMIFEGFLLFSDPPKPGVDKVVRDLHSLGVELKVITGDHRDVARHLAGAVGLEVRGLMTGRELSALRDEALWHQAERTTIFAEVDPNQKERIIRALQATGHVVGYMGDGINDAPALHAADVGISVDTAVDVAREAADFVLLRHDLETLRAGIEEGRTTFANTLKYILTTESANFGNMLSMAAASIFLPFLPLLAPQVLLNNFLSDIPAMTIARDNVDPELIANPRRWDIAFIRRFMLIFGAISSLFDAITFVTLAVLFRASPSGFRTGWFVESLMTELLVALVVRTRRSFWKSRPGRWLSVSTAIVAAVAIALPYTPPGALFGLHPIPPATLAVLMGITAAYVWTVEIAKRWIFARLLGNAG